jgi:hypothetical protein
MHVTWGVATELRGSRWVHAYDLDQGRIPHPLNAEYEVRRDLEWRTAVEAPRCQHCLEIVGQYRHAADASLPAARGLHATWQHVTAHRWALTQDDTVRAEINLASRPSSGDATLAYHVSSPGLAHAMNFGNLDDAKRFVEDRLGVKPAH